jgi:hypothetical protein
MSLHSFHIWKEKEFSLFVKSRQGREAHPASRRRGFLAKALYLNKRLYWT